MSNSAETDWYRWPTVSERPIVVDYDRLDEHLAARDWRAAHDTTKEIVRQVARESLGCRNELLAVEHVVELPCELLRPLDVRWERASGGRFGLCVQLRTYRELGGSECFDARVWSTFRERVGWESGMHYSLDAPVGHLPFLVSPDMVSLDTADAFMRWSDCDVDERGLFLFGMFYDRLERCGLGGLVSPDERHP